MKARHTGTKGKWQTPHTGNPATGPIRLFVKFTSLLALAFVAGGCVQVPAYEQGHVSKPNMTFEDAGAFVSSSRLLPQVEPGSASSGGAQGAGCTACR